jgi:hypothetical protein
MVSRERSFVSLPIPGYENLDPRLGRQRQPPNLLCEGSGTLKRNQLGILVSSDQKIIDADQGLAGTDYRSGLLSPVLAGRSPNYFSTVGVMMGWQTSGLVGS